MSVRWSFILVPAPVLVLSGACGPQVMPSPYLAECPAAESAPGYPVVVTVDAPVNPGKAWLDSAARAAAHRWIVPSGRRTYRQHWSAAASRLLPPEPRWSDDWTPDVRHRAALAVTMYRDGGTGSPVLQHASDDRSFDESLETIFTDPMPSSPEFPPLPANAPDSVRLIVSFGEEPAAGDGVARFAAQQSAPRLVPGTEMERARIGPPRPPPLPRVVQYDIDASGQFVDGSFAVLQGPDQREEFRGFAPGPPRYIPAFSNCRPIALTVIE